MCSVYCADVRAWLRVLPVRERALRQLLRHYSSEASVSQWLRAVGLGALVAPFARAAVDGLLVASLSPAHIAKELKVIYDSYSGSWLCSSDSGSDLLTLALALFFAIFRRFFLSFICLFL